MSERREGEMWASTAWPGHSHRSPIPAGDVSLVVVGVSMVLRRCVAMHHRGLQTYPFVSLRAHGEIANTKETGRFRDSSRVAYKEGESVRV